MFSFHLDLVIPTLDVDEFSQDFSIFSLSVTCNITFPSHNNSTGTTFPSIQFNCITEEQHFHCPLQNEVINDDSLSPSIPYLVSKINKPPLNFNPDSVGPVGKIGVEPLPVTNLRCSSGASLNKPPSVTEYSPLMEPELICKTREALANSERNIQLCEEGVGGTYFILDKGKKFGIFKPTDEEPGAINNPKKNLQNPLLPPGGGSKREDAAYLIDQGYAGVPETYFIHNLQYSSMLNCTGVSKSGSLQLFVENDGDSSSMSSSRFLTSDVHNIGILDIRLFNMDRNGENILVRKVGNLYRLIPIDHTYILPPSLDNAWFEWHHWRQAKEPFSPETLHYIASIDIEKDTQVLRSVGIEEECIRTMKVTTTLLKKGAEAGLNLFEIATMVCRKNRNLPSVLERLVVQSEERGMNEEEFQRLVEEAVMIRK